MFQLRQGACRARVSIKRKGKGDEGGWSKGGSNGGLKGGKDQDGFTKWRLENMDASEIYLGRWNAKEVLITQREGEIVFLVADGAAKLSGRDYEFREPTPRREKTVRRENFSGDTHVEAEESQRTDSRDDIEARRDFWSIQGDFIYRRHIEPKLRCYAVDEAQEKTY